MDSSADSHLLLGTLARVTTRPGEADREKMHSSNAGGLRYCMGQGKYDHQPGRKGRKEGKREGGREG